MFIIPPLRPRAAALSLLLALCACAAGPESRARLAERVGAGLAPARYQEGGFDLAARQRLTPGAARLVVYIEGDGFAWKSRTRPSDDPTPLDPVALRLAALDPAPSVVWLARPCQYGAGAPCAAQYWTQARFAPEVVDAYDRLLDRLKSAAGATGLELVGFSGGGALAALLAERREDVALLVTVAAPLDLAAWTRFHKVSAMTGSLDPATHAARLSGRKQLHLSGMDDEVVPGFIATGFAGRQDPPAPTRSLPGFNHGCCWTDGWAASIAAARK